MRHSNGILEQALNVPTCEQSHHTTELPKQFLNVQKEFWNRLLNIRMCHRVGILEQPLNVPKCHRDRILEQPLNVSKCHRDGVLKQPLNVPRCHRDRILDQALNVPMCHT